MPFTAKTFPNVYLSDVKLFPKFPYALKPLDNTSPASVNTNIVLFSTAASTAFVTFAIFVGKYLSTLFPKPSCPLPL